jgi:hypothetical protein
MVILNDVQITLLLHSVGRPTTSKNYEALDLGYTEQYWGLKESKMALWGEVQNGVHCYSFDKNTSYQFPHLGTLRFTDLTFAFIGECHQSSNGGPFLANAMNSWPTNPDTYVAAWSHKDMQRIDWSKRDLYTHFGMTVSASQAVNPAMVVITIPQFDTDLTVVQNVIDYVELDIL